HPPGSGPLPRLPAQRRCGERSSCVVRPSLNRLASAVEVNGFEDVVRADGDPVDRLTDGVTDRVANRGCHRHDRRLRNTPCTIRPGSITMLHKDAFDVRDVNRQRETIRLKGSLLVAGVLDIEPFIKDVAETLRHRTLDLTTHCIRVDRLADLLSYDVTHHLYL